MYARNILVLHSVLDYYFGCNNKFNRAQTIAYEDWEVVPSSEAQNSVHAKDIID